MNTGTRAIRLAKTNGQLTAQELWTSRNLKPDFTDLVSYQGYAYGVDAGIFTCIDLKTGERKWKGGHYGKGQVLLLENRAPPPTELQAEPVYQVQPPRPTWGRGAPRWTSCSSSSLGLLADDGW